MDQESILNRQKDLIVLRKIQCTLIVVVCGISIEVLKIQTTFKYSKVAARVGLLPNPISIFLKDDTGSILDEVADRIELDN